MSKTPRVDAYKCKAYEFTGDTYVCGLILAYKLETELAEAKELISQLREQRKCECSETDACRFARERDEARELLAKWVDPTFYDDHCILLKEQTEQFLERTK